MRVNRTAHDHGFTVIPNEIAQSARLSPIAVGLLVRLLSLKDGTAVDVVKLAHSLPGVGRKAVSGALAELVDAGYYVRETVFNADTRQVTTRTAVYDTPQLANPLVTPIAATPTITAPTVEQSATNPVKNSGKETPLEALAAPVVDAEREASDEGREGMSIDDEQRAASMALIARVGRIEPRLTVGLIEAGPVVPLVAEWLSRGATDLQVKTVLTAGLPAEVRSPVALMVNRLTRKMPDRRTAPVVMTHFECPDCSRPGRVAGACRDCRVSKSETVDSVKVPAARGAILARQALAASRDARVAC